MYVVNQTADSAMQGASKSNKTKTLCLSAEHLIKLFILFLDGAIGMANSGISGAVNGINRGVNGAVNAASELRFD